MTRKIPTRTSKALVVTLMSFATGLLVAPLAVAGPISVETGGAPRLPKVQLEPIATASLPACAASTEGTTYYDTTANALSVCNASANVSVAGAGACTNQFVRATVAGAAPTCAAVADADLASNYSGTGTCTAQFVRAVNDNAAPTCASVVLSADVTGVLPVANGGSNKAMTLDIGGLLWTDADSFEVLAPGATRRILMSNSATSPSWVTNQDTWTGVCFSAAGSGVCESEAVPAFQGVFRADLTGTAITGVTCSWAGENSGAGVVVVGVIDCGGVPGACAAPSTVCSCTIDDNCTTTTANLPMYCACSGTLTKDRFYMLTFTGGTTCATNNPGQVVCTAHFVP